MAKEKLYRVVAKPVGKAPALSGAAHVDDLPAGQKQSVVKRSAVRVYELRATSPAEAKSIVEQRERELEEAGHPKYRAGTAKPA